MILKIILALLCGIAAGTITGLLPGLHINMIAVLIVALSFSLSQYFPIITIVIFIVSMSITHTFIDFIPSVFLGSPDEDTGLSVLPGHSLLLEGKGYHAVIYTLYGSLIGIFIILIFSPIFIFFLPKIYIYIKPVIFYMLLLASFYLVLREKNKVLSIMIFLLAGFIGLSTYNLNIKDPLMPMLTGLFGSSSLIISLTKKQKIPKQKISKIKIELKEFLDTAFATSIASPLCSFLPALGSGQAAVISSDLTEEKNKKQFLMLLGSINTIIMGLGIISIYSLNITRSGSSVAISKLLTNFTPSHLILIILTIFSSGILSFFIGKKLAKMFALNINKINYFKLSILILSFLIMLVIYFSGLTGLILFITSTFLGLFTILSGARRTLLMGSLMLTSLILYFPF